MTETKNGVRVRLDPMTDDEYAAYMATSVAGYAREKVAAGQWSANDAEKLSREEHDVLLPAGLATPGNYLYTVRAAAPTRDGVPVGLVWIALRDKAGACEAFVYDIEMRQEARGRGYGRATMTACAELARRLGASSVGLHVFGHNRVAYALYESLGFVPTSIMMSLDLSAAEGRSRRGGPGVSA